MTKALLFLFITGCISATAQTLRPSSPASATGKLAAIQLSRATSTTDTSGLVDLERGPDTQPEFPSDVRAYLAEHLFCPESLRHSGIDGRVVFKFIVDAEGRVVSASLKKSSGDAAWDSSMIAMLLAMPQWKPATKGGKPVAVAFYLPIYICLE